MRISYWSSDVCSSDLNQVLGDRWRRPDTHHLPELSVAVHGQSFSTPAVTENLVLAYPPAEQHVFNIGILHTALAGRQGHADYAPCSVEDLRSRGYDYWALGHVHEFEVVSTEPYVVFPGNVQGRTIRETGAKGAVLVAVADGDVTSVERIELDVIRWARLGRKSVVEGQRVSVRVDLGGR